MQDIPDSELLRRFGQNQSDEAFSELVRRHINLVYSVALRHTANAHHAQEITQAVFLVLVRKAALLGRETILSGWLYHTARLTAANFRRAEISQVRREQEVYVQSTLEESSPDAVWRELAPLLDEAMSHLDPTDRDAVVLRYFEKQDLRAVGTALRISDDAAQKRVSRAVERLREFFTKRGITVGASGLAVAITANAIQAAPVGLATTIATTAAIVGTTLVATTTATATKAIVMTTLQKTIIAATLVAAVCTGIYQTRQASTLRSQSQLLQQQQAPLAEQIQQLSKDHDDLTRQLGALRDENERLNRNTPELLRLRGQVASLKANSQAEKAGDQIGKTMGDWVSRATELQRHIEKMPGARIPEFQFLRDIDWLDAVKELRVDTDAGMANAVGQITQVAKVQFANQMSPALRKFIEANTGELPTQLAQLKPFFLVPVGDEVLERYEPLRSGNVKDVPEHNRKCALISEKRFAADSTGHTMIQIGDSTFQNLSAY